MCLRSSPELIEPRAQNASCKKGKNPRKANISKAVDTRTILLEVSGRGADGLSQPPSAPRSLAFSAVHVRSVRSHRPATKLFS